MPEGHIERPQLERERALPLLGSERGVCVVSWIRSLLAHLKRKSRNYGAGREE